MESAKARYRAEEAWRTECPAPVGPEPWPGGAASWCRESGAEPAWGGERYRRLVGRLPALVFELTPDGTCRFVNDAVTALTGYRTDQLLGRDFWQTLCPGALTRPAAALRARLASGDVSGYELTLATASGTPRVLALDTANEYGPDGRLAAVLGCGLDLTPRRQAETAQRQLAAIVAGSDDAIVGESLDGVIVSWNAAAERLYGYPAAEALGRSAFLLVPPDRAGELPPLLRRLRRGERVDHFETVRVRKGGQLVHVSLSLSPIRDESGAITGTSTIARDISQRKHAEAALRESHQNLRALIHHSPLAIFTLDRAGRVEVWNAAAERVFGWKADEVRGRDLPIVPDDRQTEFRELLAGALSGRAAAGHEIPLRRRDGGRVEASLSLAPAYDTTWSGTGVIGFAADITAHKRLQAQFRHAQKLDALGRVAGGVAHDFNNLLTVIKGYSDILFNRLPPNDPTRELVSEIRKSGDRAASLTRHLLAFSRQQVLAPVVLDLNPLVADMGKMIRRLIGEHIEVVTDLDPDLGRVKADPGQIDQVLMNLVLNARDAMPEGGKLTIRTRDVQLTAADLPALAEARPGAYVLLSVADTGCGMDEATQSHLFEPFFTTKEPGKGTGLGLATVYGIVGQSGGHITVTSAPGQGATFDVYLPRFEGQAEEAPEAAPVLPRGGTETVLLVEDEEHVRGLAARVLRAAGYTVLEARDGQDALDVVGRHVGPLQLLLTDLSMPRLGGREVAAQLTTRQPGLRVLYCSGDATATNRQSGAVPAPMLHKPFTPGQLTRKVREVLDER